MRELICITCPKGCHLKVDEENDYDIDEFEQSFYKKTKKHKNVM